MNKRVLLYPGSFDPPTLGHFDVVKRGCKLCEKLIIGVAGDADRKRFLFSAAERKEMFESYLEGCNLPVEVHFFDGLTVDYAKELNAFGILRGLRTYSDFEYEFQMAAMNKHLCSELETIFIRTSDALAHISSTFVKNVARHTAADKMVSPYVMECLRRKLG